MRLWRDTGEAMSVSLREQRRADTIRIHIEALVHQLKVGEWSWFFVEQP